jgi:hypothetical protein
MVPARLFGRAGLPGGRRATCNVTFENAVTTLSPLNIEFLECFVKQHQ